ncbi:recombinase family protein [Glutamicibacter sp. AOP5-A2-18]|uniref:recombinase family protein n=1 Tax=Glutamicibacter sp. AOP5-A2-18 TaxID=3457656 RepID=UPI004033B398
MALIGYARVSTADQNLDGQLDALVEAGVKTRNIYQEKKSGKSAKDRPELNKMLEELEPGDVVVVAKLDRLGRSMIDLVSTVKKIEEKGAQFRALDKSNMDTTTPDGKLIFGIFATLAEYERELIVARTNVGLEAARRRGKTGGRPKVDSDNPKVKKAKEMDAKKVDIEDIAKTLEVSRATVYRYLSM